MKTIRFESNMDTDAISSLIVDLMRDYAPKDIAVLGRNHFLLKRLSTKLNEISIPHTYIGRQHELMAGQPFVVFHAFLKLLVNPYSNLDFLLIRDILGLSRAEYNEIRLRATQESKSHFQVWMHVDDEDRIIPENLVESEKLKAVRRIWFELAGSEWLFHEAVRNLMVPEMNLPEGVEKVKEFVDEWLLDNPEGTAADYLDWLATYDLQDEIEESDDKLKLLTVHAAKGLEWPLVVIVGCNEGIIPSKKAIDADETEQERRLFYVAMTRAKDSLILAVRPERKEDERGKVYFNPVSRFVKEAIL